MFIAYTVITALLCTVLLGSAGAKFTRPRRLVDQMSILALPEVMLPFLGVAQVAGSVGLVAGLWLAPLGIAAAVGVILYFLGAVGAHLRVKDFAGTSPAAVLAVCAVGAAVLRVLTV